MTIIGNLATLATSMPDRTLQLSLLSSTVPPEIKVDPPFLLPTNKQVRTIQQT